MRTSALPQLFVAGLCAFGLVVGVTTVVEYPADAVAQKTAVDLRNNGEAATSERVERRIDRGRDYFVAGVLVVFAVADEQVQTELHYIEESEDSESRLDPPPPVAPSSIVAERTGRFDAAPPDSRYAPPLEIIHVAGDPTLAMARIDVVRLSERTTADLLLGVIGFVPLVALILVPRWRRWVTSGLRATSSA